MAEEGAISIVWQSSVVDIQPTSRYADGAPDTASIDTTVLLARPVGADALAATFDTADVTMVADGPLALIRQRVEVGRIDDRFRFKLTVPPAGTEIVKGGTYSTLVLLPGDGVTPEGPIYEVELVGWSKDPEPQVFGTGHLPAIGGRIGAAWRARQDPDSVVEYVYNMIRDRA